MDERAPHATRSKWIVRGKLDAYELADLLSNQHTLFLAFNATAIGKPFDEAPLPRAEA